MVTAREMAEYNEQFKPKTERFPSTNGLPGSSGLADGRMGLVANTKNPGLSTAANDACARVARLIELHEGALIRLRGSHPEEPRPAIGGEDVASSLLRLHDMLSFLERQSEEILKIIG